MKYVFLIFAYIMMASPSAYAKLDARAIAGLKSLDPVSRLEQVCDVELMERVGADKTNNHEPDRAIGEATAAMTMEGDVLTAPGGALRSHGHWYHVSYVCTGSKDHMKVLKLTYKLGERIPPSEWDHDNLWN